MLRLLTIVQSLPLFVGTLQQVAFRDLRLKQAFQFHLEALSFSSNLLSTESRPCPRRCPLKLNQAPFLSTTLSSQARSRMEPAFEIPSSNKISNSATWKGGAILFFTTLTLTRLPTSLLSGPLMPAALRRSILTEE